jgi:hypothetical protein
MGTLIPGATYIYERVNGVVYAREMGASADTRKEVGWNYDSRTRDGRPLFEHIKDSKLWGDIHRAAENNPALQDALNLVIEIYHLSNKS